MAQIQSDWLYKGESFTTPGTQLDWIYLGEQFNVGGPASYSVNMLVTELQDVAAQSYSRLGALSVSPEGSLVQSLSRQGYAAAAMTPEAGVERAITNSGIRASVLSPEASLAQNVAAEGYAAHEVTSESAIASPFSYKYGVTSSRTAESTVVRSSANWQAKTQNLAIESASNFDRTNVGYTLPINQTEDSIAEVRISPHYSFSALTSEAPISSPTALAGLGTVERTTEHSVAMGNVRQGYGSLLRTLEPIAARARGTEAFSVQTKTTGSQAVRAITNQQEHTLMVAAEDHLTPAHASWTAFAEMTMTEDGPIRLPIHGQWKFQAWSMESTSTAMQHYVYSFFVGAVGPNAVFIPIDHVIPEAPINLGPESITINRRDAIEAGIGRRTVFIVIDKETL